MKILDSDAEKFRDPACSINITYDGFLDASDIIITNYSETQYDSDELIKPFIKRNNPEEYGYFKLSKENEQRLTNFTVNLTKQIITEFNDRSEIYFTGEVRFEDQSVIEIKKLLGSDLASPQSLAKYLTNLCGTRILLLGSQNSISEAIKIFNRDVEILHSEEFGYNNDHSAYISSELIITKDSFIEKETVIKYCEVGKRNKLGFSLADEEELLGIKRGLVEDFIPWDDTIRTISALSFSFLPVIFPFLEGVNSKKPYLMLKGPSGCGKSLMSEVLQQLYGAFDNLIPWNSTSTAINVTGNSFKDCVFMVDDFKQQNFNSEYKINEAMTSIQNYADQTSKQRSNTSLTLRDEKFIKGFLFISAEDLVISEASGVARGIIIDMENKQPDYEGEVRLRKLAKEFNKLTPYFIQKALNIPTSNYEKLFSMNKQFFLEIVELDNLQGNNIPRLVNNLALLKTSWDIVKSFIFPVDMTELRMEYDVLYSADLKQLFLSNYKRVQHQNPETKFEETLWDLIESNALILDNAEERIWDDSKRIGLYRIYNTSEGRKVKIAFNFNKAYKIVNSYLSDQGGIGNSKESLKSKLIQLGKIRVVGDRVSLTHSTKVRGVEWIGEYPRDYFNLP